jgi:phosphatidylglycerophosphate synthase
MLDRVAQRIIGPGLDRLGVFFARRGVTADQVTVVGFAIGVAAAGAIAARLYALALLLILASRFCDGLDGAVARANEATDRGGFLDIVLDFAFYGLVPLGFVFADPQANGIAGATLLFSFYVNGASFLAYAVMAEKQGLVSDSRGDKSLHFTAGLAEATETIVVFLVFCVFPDSFAQIAYAFAAVTLVTAVSRIFLAMRVFS